MEHELGPRQAARIRLADVPVGPLERQRLLAGERLGERPPELAAGPGYEDAAVAASRSDRIGDCVLQTCFTRASFHGMARSSGAAASYSSVTW